MKNIAIIPARGGSKRLPEKNILDLGGLPLLVHSINYAKANEGIVDAIYVSTDCPKIKSVALEHGALVIDRPEAISGDLEPTISTLQHVLEHVNETFENVVLLQPTNPLRPQNLLEKAFVHFLDKDCDSLMTISRNYQKFGKLINEKFVPFNYKIGQRSQDLEPLYFENGLLYITKASVVKKGEIVGGHNYPLEVNHPYSKVDIDDIEDLKFAAFILNQYPNE
ncbi:MAG: acylneuraminate cytidylyltransferase [Bacteroidetes bacterium MedPE-SWsnd-G2]|nr:MAG: acylneuraminate cytidylyltransferase [Bacteroidetes bacterium MedPE-SWsnd-G2]